MANSTGTVSVSGFTSGKAVAGTTARHFPAGKCGEGNVAVLIVGCETLTHFDVTTGTSAICLCSSRALTL